MHQKTDFDGARDYILDLLRNKLDSNLYYHNADHTTDVYQACLRLIELEGIGDADKLLIETAALYHDAGMLLEYDNHEEKSVEIIREVLPRFGYDAEQIERIGRMILCTKLPQDACCLNSKILCDADMDYLGRNDFFMIAHRLRYEWEVMNNYIGLLEWYEFQLKFLQQHHFYTESARKLREEGMHKNIIELKRLLGKSDL